jgi:hypothetical protein
VGFYGGINYGFGYTGVGFAGGRWDRGVFRYNTAVTHVDTKIIRNTYVDRTVIVNNTTINRVSFNGGNGGIRAVPNHEERIAENEHHTAPIAAQMQHEHMASTDHAFLASENHGHPGVAATARPGEFSGHGATESHGASFHPPAGNEPHGEAHGNRDSHDGPHSDAKHNSEKPKDRDDHGDHHGNH